MSVWSIERFDAGCLTPDADYIARHFQAFCLLGEVAEWLKAHAWKACIRETVSWVRIPPSPPAPFRRGILRRPTVS